MTTSRVLLLAFALVAAAPATAAEPELANFAGPGGAVWCVRFAPDGRSLAACGESPDILVWCATTHKQLARLTGHRGPVGSVVFSPDGSLLASAGHDGTARLWACAGFSPRAVLMGDDSRVLAVVFSADGKLVATGSASGLVKLWDAVTGRELFTLQSGPGPLGGHALAFAPDGQMLAAAAVAVCVWDTASGLRLASWSGPERVESVLFTSDGRALLAAGRDGVCVWQLAGAKVRAELPGPDAGAGLVPLDGGRFVLAYGGRWRKNLVGWDAATWSEVYSADGRPFGAGTIDALAATPKGHVVALTSATDARAQLWTWSERDGYFRLRPAAYLRGHAGGVWCAAFAPDGRTLATAGADGTVRHWDVVEALKRGLR
jgi:WD40 repeat protein